MVNRIPKVINLLMGLGEGGAIVLGGALEENWGESGSAVTMDDDTGVVSSFIAIDSVELDAEPGSSFGASVDVVVVFERVELGAGWL